MKFCGVLTCAAFLGTPSRTLEATPTAKIIQMISDLQAKNLSAGAESQKVYAEFSEFCEHRSKDPQYDIKIGKDEKTDLEATFAKEAAKSGAHDEKIEATEIRDKVFAEFSAEEKELMVVIDMIKRAIGILEREMAKSGASMLQLQNTGSDVQDLNVLMQASALSAKDEAKLNRDKEFADFSADEKELMEVIDMIKRAIGILEREMAKSGASMLQLQNTGSVVQDLNVSMQASALSAKDGAKLSALVQESRLADQDAEAGATEAATSEGHGSGIIETLESQLEEAHGHKAAKRLQQLKQICL